MGSELVEGQAIENVADSKRVRVMPTTMEQYRQAKATYQKLHNQAKKDLIDRFNELTRELLQIQRELKEDFGHKVAIPTKAKTPPRRAERVPPKQDTQSTPNSKPTRIEKSLSVQRKKLEDALSTGKPEKAIKDRIYELEDELRLALSEQELPQVVKSARDEYAEDLLGFVVSHRGGRPVEILDADGKRTVGAL